MKLINPSYKIINQNPGLDGIYEAIEQAGRTCYKSIGTRYFKLPLGGDNMPDIWHWVRENLSTYTKIEGDGIRSKVLNGYASIANKDVKNFKGIEEYESEFNPRYHQNITAKEFVDRMVKSGHHAMLEFGTVYLAMECDDLNEEKYKLNDYSKALVYNNTLYVTTNYRVLVEHGWLDDLEYLCEPTEYHEKRVCVRFTTDRGVANELVRHRTFSFAQESTRYCNYSKDKFGNELTFIIPSWCDLKDSSINSTYTLQFKTIGEMMFVNSMLSSEVYYLQLIEDKYTPQQARQVLPNALKTEINMCGFVSDWKHFFSLRSSHAGAKGMHPDMDKIANMVYDEFNEIYK